MPRSQHLVSVSARYEQFAKQIGYWSFNRWAVKQGLDLEATCAVIRNVF